MNNKKEILIYSIEEFLKNIYFDNLRIKKPYIVISIRDDDREIPFNFKKTSLCKDFIVSEFIDLSPKRVFELSSQLKSFIDKELYFNKKKAFEIFNFLKEHKEKDDFDTVVIHCMAGQSRSQAIGLFTEIYLNNDYSNLKNRIHSGNIYYFLELQKFLPIDKQVPKNKLLNILNQQEKKINFSKDIFI